MTAPDQPKASFLRSGGWWLVAALTLAGLALAYFAAQIVGSRDARAVGDRSEFASYGFTLEPCLVPRDLLVTSGMRRDGLAAMVEPASWSVAQADLASASRTKFLVPSDRVIGVKIGGQARAYPLRLLVWHEVVNDTLAGVPIAVTYNALCDSAVVFSRTIAGRTLAFGVSGLLFDSNLVMYDRAGDRAAESLWSQLLFKAIAGPAAAQGARLPVLPITVEAWADWRRENPDTGVLAPDPRMARRYASDPYVSYFGNDLLRFPVRPLPAPARYPLKTPLVAVGGTGGWTAFPFGALEKGTVSASASGMARALTFRPPVPTVAVNTAMLPAGTGVVYASYFAWFATHHADTTWVPPLTAP